MLQYNTYILLFISVLSVWFSSRVAILRLGVFHSIRYWQLFLWVTLIAAFFSNLITAIGIIELGIFYLLLQYYRYKFYNYRAGLWCYQFVCWVGVVGFALLFYLHQAVGFHNLLILDKVRFTTDAVPFTMYLNLDKTIVGIILAGVMLPVNQTLLDWKATFKSVSMYFPFVVVILLGLSYWFKYIHFEPKIINGLFIWGINNLFFVCFAEEVLFRGFIQNSLSRLNYLYSNIIAIFIAAILFGLLHINGGIKYAILATVAGILYGYIYQKTKRIEVSILIHFAVNLAHVLWFTYPALAV